MTNLPPSEASDLLQPIVIPDEQSPAPTVTHDGAQSLAQGASLANGVQVYGAPESSSYVSPCKLRIPVFCIVSPQ